MHEFIERLEKKKEEKVNLCMCLFHKPQSLVLFNKTNEIEKKVMRDSSQTPDFCNKITHFS